MLAIPVRRTLCMQNNLFLQKYLDHSILNILYIFFFFYEICQKYILMLSHTHLKSKSKAAVFPGKPVVAGNATKGHILHLGLVISTICPLDNIFVKKPT